MPGFDSGMTTFHSVCQPDAPASRDGLDQRAVDAHHRVEDRHDHEQRVEVDEGEDHREVGVDQPFDRLADEADPDQRLVDEPVAAEQRNPRDHADDVRGPERDGADEEQRDLHRRRADMEGEEIGDEEADHEGDQPHREAELQRREIGLEGDAELGKLVEAALEDLDVAARREGRDDLVFVVVPEAHHHGEAERDQEEHHEHRGERRDLQPRRDAAREQRASARRLCRRGFGRRRLRQLAEGGLFSDRDRHSDGLRYDTRSSPRSRHGRACPGHPDHVARPCPTDRVAGTSPAMTADVFDAVRRSTSGSSGGSRDDPHAAMNSFHFLTR